MPKEFLRISLEIPHVYLMVCLRCSCDFLFLACFGTPWEQEWKPFCRNGNPSEGDEDVRAVMGSFFENHTHFHALDGSGYQLAQEQISKIDEINPSVAARLSAAFRKFLRFLCFNMIAPDFDLRCFGRIYALICIGSSFLPSLR